MCGREGHGPPQGGGVGSGEAGLDAIGCDVGGSPRPGRHAGAVLGVGVCGHAGRLPRGWGSERKGWLRGAAFGRESTARAGRCSTARGVAPGSETPQRGLSVGVVGGLEGGRSIPPGEATVCLSADTITRNSPPFSRKNLKNFCRKNCREKVGGCARRPQPVTVLVRFGETAPLRSGQSGAAPAGEGRNLCRVLPREHRGTGHKRSGGAKDKKRPASSGGNQQEARALNEAEGRARAIAGLGSGMKDATEQKIARVLNSQVNRDSPFGALRGPPESILTPPLFEGRKPDMGALCFPRFMRFASFILGGRVSS